MLQKLTLKNFQKHQTITLNLSEPLTVLVGDSRQGKSSVLRALRWLCHGGHSTGYLRHGESQIKVILRVDDHKIIRIKSKSENTYQIDENEAYRSVGVNVPEDVASLLQLSEVNFQGQLDPPFWLSLSPSEAARELNKVVSLDLIDSTLANLASGLRKQHTQEELIKARLTQTEDKLKQLHWVPYAEQDLQRIEQLEEDTASRRHRIERMASLLEEAEEITNRLEDATERTLDASALRTTLERVTMLGKRIQRMESLLESYDSIKESLTSSEQRLESVRSELNELRANGCPLCGK